MLKNNKKVFRTTDTLIGQGTVVEGNLHCEANLRIEGKFHGEIHCLGELIIGESGEASSNIKASEVIVAGKVIGDIISHGKLTITSNGQVDGSVHVVNLIIMEGGILNGNSKMEKAPVSVVKEKVKKVVQPEAG
ncbi:bactofilin family protein [Paenibacillus segetis]|uniref:Polymer-forming cytoskeletal protein n=1 Tax=Paenibacillus segetis TaxID=1325360 RepID=A0ABQ1Y5X4_9BACL|nr:polymer-forming cytoskeletal protein [Paenibacillus segetis]GGH12713.1 hypothetical protein GCM10008013_05300 [Paenibacillus segetis]